MPAPVIRLCVLDCDGTLVDSQFAITGAMVAAFAAHQLPAPTSAAILAVVGLSLPTAVAALLPESDDERLIARVSRSYAEAYHALRRQQRVAEPLYPGVADMLNAIEAAGWRLALATGKSRRGAIATLDAHGLTGRFVSIQTADDNPGKPAPRMLLRAVDEAGTEPEGAVMVGDSCFDMMMAANAGVRAIGVAWGYQSAMDLRSAGAEVVVEEAIEVAAVLSPPLGTSR